MTITHIENFFTNFSFFLLFCMMLYYWIKTSFFSKASNFSFGFYGMFLSNISLSILLTIRWVNSTHLPLSNLYESLIFLTWSITLIQIIVQKTSGLDFLGIVLCPLALFIFGFASFSLPAEIQGITPLVPALQSNWLLMHVTVMILSYGTLLCGCVLSITYLFLNTEISSVFKKIKKQVNFFSSKELISNSSLSEISVIQNSKNFSLENNQAFFQIQPGTFFGNAWGDFQFKLDNLSYRIIGIGFSFLTIGILSGAVWANETWGSYWSWDPKETWAFITWLIFAIYLHSRLNYGWQGKKPAIIASIGFMVIWICYLGVNLVGKGLHSYGWIQFS